MRTFVHLIVIAAIVAITASAYAQVAPTNLDFEMDIAHGNAVPLPWVVAQHQPHYDVTLDSTQAFSGRHSLTIRSHGTPSDDEFENVMQSLDAAPYRGKQVRFRAAVRLSKKENGEAHLWMRVDRPEQREGFFAANSSHPITSPQWGEYQIMGYVAPDAERVFIGCFLNGEGEAGFDAVEFTAMNAGKLAADSLPEFLTIETPDGNTTLVPVRDIWSVFLLPGEMTVLLKGGKGQMRAIGDYAWFAKPFLLR